MKYLKSFSQLNESLSDKVSESIDINIKNDIEDIAIELIDCDINYKLSDCQYHKDGINGKECLRISLKDNSNRFFRIDNIEDVLLRLMDYLKGSGYSIDIGIPNSDDYLSIDDFMDEFSGEELYHINILIYDSKPFNGKYVDEDGFTDGD